MYQILNGNLIIAQSGTLAGCVEQLAHATFPTVVKIERIQDVQYVTVCNDVWVDKERASKRCYTMEYTRCEILADIAHDVCRMNGYRLQKIER